MPGGEIDGQKSKGNGAGSPNQLIEPPIERYYTDPMQNNQTTLFSDSLPGSSSDFLRSIYSSLPALSQDSGSMDLFEEFSQEEELLSEYEGRVSYSDSFSSSDPSPNSVQYAMEEMFRRKGEETIKR